jgi:hypothetical protein
MFLAGSPLDPIPPGTLPGNLGSAVDTIIGWTLTLSLLACVVGGIVGLAMVGIGNTSERPELAARGKRGAMWACLAAAGLGLIWGVITAFYNLGK